MQKDWFEEIITTIEKNSKDNKATITNVELWAKSWRKERELALTLTDISGQRELLKAYEKMLINAGDMTGNIKEEDRNDFIYAFNCG